ncbi:hypothetical protein AMTRI_Chr04g252170 [Amborella trichopoda]
MILAWVDYLRNFLNLRIEASIVEGIIQEMILSKIFFFKKCIYICHGFCNSRIQLVLKILFAFKNRVGLELSLHMTLHVLSGCLFNGKLTFLVFLCFLGTFGR